MSIVGIIMSTIYHDACGGYNEYREVMIPLKWRNSCRTLSTSLFMIPILVLAFEILSVPATTRPQCYRFSETPCSGPGSMRNC